MTDLENKEIRGITGKVLVIVMTGSLSVCATFIWGVAKIQSTMALQEYRITVLEGKTKDIENKFTKTIANK